LPNGKEWPDDILTTSDTCALPTHVYDAHRGGVKSQNIVALCNFDYTGPLSEAVLLANIAFRVQGEFDWDAAAMKSSRDDVNGMLRREYRKGWEA
jgi:hypothetical protein